MHRVYDDVAKDVHVSLPEQLYLVGWEFYWLFLPSRGASLPVIGITSTVQVLKNSDMEGWEGMECVAEWAALGLLNWKG